MHDLQRIDTTLRWKIEHALVVDKDCLMNMQVCAGLAVIQSFMRMNLVADVRMEIATNASMQGS